MLDVLCILRWGDGRNFFFEREGDCLVSSRIDAYGFRNAVEIAGRAVPLLPFSAVHRKLYCVTVGSVERLILVQKGLNPEFAGRDIEKTSLWIAEATLADASTQ